MRESVAVVCHGQGAIAVSDKSRTPRPQEISSLKQLFSYPEWLGLLKDDDEDITIFQGNRYPQLRSAKLPLHSESDDLKGGNNAGVRSTRLDRRVFLKGLLTWCVFADDV